jgi:hypothetical protein
MASGRSAQNIAPHLTEFRHKAGSPKARARQLAGTALETADAPRFRQPRRS